MSSSNLKQVKDRKQHHLQKHWFGSGERYHADEVEDTLEARRKNSRASSGSPLTIPELLYNRTCHTSKIIRGLLGIWQQRAEGHWSQALKRKGVRQLKDQVRRRMQVT